MGRVVVVGDIVCITQSGDGTVVHLAVVPALLGDGVAVPLPYTVPLVDAVLFHDGTGLGEGDLGLGVAMKRAIVVGDDPDVAA